MQVHSGDASTNVVETIQQNYKSKVDGSFNTEIDNNVSKITAE